MEELSRLVDTLRQENAALLSENERLKKLLGLSSAAEAADALAGDTVEDDEEEDEEEEDVTDEHLASDGEQDAFYESFASAFLTPTAEWTSPLLEIDDDGDRDSATEGEESVIFLNPTQRTETQQFLKQQLPHLLDRCRISSLDARRNTRSTTYLEAPDASRNKRGAHLDLSRYPFLLVHLIFERCCTSARDRRALACVAKAFSVHNKYKRRCKIIVELLETERSYVNSLWFALHYYRGPLLKSKSIKPKVAQQIFGDVETLFGINSLILNEFNERISVYDPEATVIGDVFEALAPALKLYQSYAQNFNAVKTLMKPLTKKLNELCKFTPQHVTLPSIMITPIQRLPRYLMILKDVISHSDSSHLDINNLRSVLELVEKIIDSVEDGLDEFNQLKEQKEMLSAISELPYAISNCTVPFELIRVGEIGSTRITCFRRFLIVSWRQETKLRYMTGFNTGSVTATNLSRILGGPGFTLIHGTAGQIKFATKTRKEADSWLATFKQILVSDDKKKLFNSPEITRRMTGHVTTTAVSPRKRQRKSRHQSTSADQTASIKNGHVLRREMKKGLLKWRRRYIVLDSESLHIYTTDGKSRKECAGSPLTITDKMMVDGGSDQRCEFTIYVDRDDFDGDMVSLKMDSAEETASWVAAVNGAVAICSAKKLSDSRGVQMSLDLLIGLKKKPEACQIYQGKENSGAVCKNCGWIEDAHAEAPMPPRSPKTPRSPRLTKSPGTSPRRASPRRLGVDSPTLAGWKSGRNASTIARRAVKQRGSLNIASTRARSPRSPRKDQDSGESPRKEKPLPAPPPT